MRGQSSQRLAFTLVELITVLAILAMLIALLLPALTRATSTAQLIGCESNLRQIGMATQMYVNENRQALPFSNWGQSQVYSNANAGWLFQTPLSSTPSVSDLSQGLLWKYLMTARVYRCPVHQAIDSSIFGKAQTNNLSSYLMNGAINDFGAQAAAAAPPSNLPKAFIHRITRFLSTDILLWEADERGSNAWNDGSSYPTETYNPSDPYYTGSGKRHNALLTLLSIDGHVEAMNRTTYWTLASSSQKNRLWCRPDTATGR